MRSPYTSPNWCFIYTNSSEMFSIKFTATQGKCGATIRINASLNIKIEDSQYLGDVGLRLSGRILSTFDWPPSIVIILKIQIILSSSFTILTSIPIWSYRLFCLIDKILNRLADLADNWVWRQESLISTMTRRNEWENEYEEQCCSQQEKISKIENMNQWKK